MGETRDSASGPNIGGRTPLTHRDQRNPLTASVSMLGFFLIMGKTRFVCYVGVCFVFDKLSVMDCNV